MDYQLPLKPFSACFNDLVDPDNDFFNYFRSINPHNIEQVMQQCHKGRGQKGYGTSLVLSRILKVKELIFSDRELANKLNQFEPYRFVSRMEKNHTPSHNTYNTLRKNLGIWGYYDIHANFVREALSLGILNPDLEGLPKNRREGLVLIADSTHLHAVASTKGKRQKDGSWIFTDKSLSFGRPHHKYRYPIGHRVHSLITITGIPMVSIVTANSVHDSYYIIPLLDLFRNRFPEITVAYVVLDKAYDAEDIYQIIFESYHIIPVIVRKKMVYPKGFTKDGIPLCPFGFPMSVAGIDYKGRRTKYLCKKICLNDRQGVICPELETDKALGMLKYTHFKDGYRKFGGALPNSIIYKRLKPYRTAIERNYGLVKENRYRMEYTNSYRGFTNVLIHVIEHDITLTQDVIFYFQRTGKVSSVIKAIKS